jgi:hypothetical protein
MLFKSIPLKCSLAIRHHHLLKTFWGWRDQQLPDGTVSLAGYVPPHRMVTAPRGIRLLARTISSGLAPPANDDDPPPF